MVDSKSGLSKINLNYKIVETEKLLCLGVLDNKTGLSSSRRILDKVLCLTVYFLG